MSILKQKLYEGETALVTGAASNIGRAVASRLAGEGALVFASDIHEDGLRALVEEIESNGGAATALPADLSGDAGWRDLYDAVHDKDLDIFVHSASPKRLEEDLAVSVSEETFDAMVNTNLRSGFFLGREIANNMVARECSGRLLYMTSLHVTAPRNLPHYSASKAGMSMVVKELARALGPKGIRVNAIAPGAIPGGGFATDEESFQPKRKIPLGRFGTADDIAKAAMGLLCDDFMGYVTGATLIVDGGIQLFNWIDFPDL